MSKKWTKQEKHCRGVKKLNGRMGWIEIYSLRRQNGHWDGRCCPANHVTSCAECIFTSARLIIEPIEDADSVRDRQKRQQSTRPHSHPHNVWARVLYYFTFHVAQGEREIYLAISMLPERHIAHRTDSQSMMTFNKRCVQLIKITRISPSDTLQTRFTEHQ